MRRLAAEVVLGAMIGVTSSSLPVAAQLAYSGTADVEVLELDRRMGDAVVRGDAALVDSMTADDFVMVHGDGWTHGGQPLLTDGKASLLQRVKSGYYDVIDFDSVQAELHGDVAITHGRYVAHVASGNDAQRAWFSVWFERVYAKRDGSWTYLSHRTVHGPVFGSSREALEHDERGAAGTVPAPPPATSKADDTPAGAEVLALEREIGAAIVRGDTAYFERATAADFVMTHGDGWTRGEPPALVDDQASFARRVASKSYAVHDYDVQAAEVHGDVAITYGRYIGHIPSSPPERRWFYVWYEKVYAKRDGRWVYLSHRTVDGAHYAAERSALDLD